MAFAIVGNSIYASMHEAEHGMLLPVRFCNDLVGALLGLFFPAPFHLLRQGHWGTIGATARMTKPLTIISPARAPSGSGCNFTAF